MLSRASVVQVCVIPCRLQECTTQSVPTNLLFSAKSVIKVIHLRKFKSELHESLSCWPTKPCIQIAA
jgi:hypothetical protein